MIWKYTYENHLKCVCSVPALLHEEGGLAEENIGPVAISFSFSEKQQAFRLYLFQNVAKKTFKRNGMEHPDPIQGLPSGPQAHL